MTLKSYLKEDKLDKRYCDYCHRFMNKHTGKNITSQDKMTYKWICKDCVEDEPKT